jgi:hypothetical protein
MSGYQRGTVQPGDLVTWHTSRGTTEGHILEVLAQPELERLARLNGDDPTEAWIKFGPLVRIECTDPGCTPCKSGWEQHPDWKHLANECQLDHATRDVEVPLW